MDKKVRHIGIVMAPLIFGFNHSTFVHKRKLEDSGYAVELIDLYEGHAVYHKDSTKKPRPPFAPRLFSGGPTERDKKLNALALSFDEHVLMEHVARAIASLDAQGIKDIVMIGAGFGGNLLLAYLEKYQTPEVAHLFMWYPHVFFKETFAREMDLSMSLHRPDFAKIPKLLKTIVFHGDKDPIVEPENLPILEKAANDQDNLELVVYPGAKHGFDTKFMQGWIPNLPFYYLLPAGRRAYNASWKRVYTELATFALGD